jgi:phage-related protein
MDTFSPPRNPNSPLDTQMQPRVLRNSFGDGYIQSIPDGLNTYPRMINPTWSPLSESDINALESFFEAHVGTVFFYTLPDETTPRKWECVKWTRSQSTGWWDMSASFQERFILT